MDIQIFKENGLEIRTVTKDGEPWFVAKDVCDSIGIKNVTQAVSVLDDDEVSMLNIGGSSGNSNIISESGMYTIVLRSRQAISIGSDSYLFKRWVTRDVIPSIRKHGGYIQTKPRDTPDDIIARAILLAGEKIKQLELTVSKAAPAIDFRNYATNNGTQWTITDAKNELEISLADLQELLVMVKFFRVRKMVRNNRLWPKDKYIDCGYCVEIQDGPNYAFTAKGMEFLNTLVYDGIVKAEAMFENDRQPDLFDGQ